MACRLIAFPLRSKAAADAHVSAWKTAPRTGVALSHPPGGGVINVECLSRIVGGTVMQVSQTAGFASDWQIGPPLSAGIYGLLAATACRLLARKATP